MARTEGTYFVYLLASKRHGTLYVGVTNDIARRVRDHKDGSGAAFTRKYKVTRLVWYDSFGQIDLAISHEKRLKKWRRAWKIELIEQNNPSWNDLHETLNA